MHGWTTGPGTSGWRMHKIYMIYTVSYAGYDKFYWNWGMILVPGGSTISEVSRYCTTVPGKIMTLYASTRTGLLKYSESGVLCILHIRMGLQPRH